MEVEAELEDPDAGGGMGAGHCPPGTRMCSEPIVHSMVCNSSPRAP